MVTRILGGKKRKSTRGRSLDLLYIFLHYFLENKYMHYGYWEEGLEPKIANLKQAQRRYVDEVFKLIPEDVKTILDVGCGSGEMARELSEMGYRVDAVCPPSIMSEYARETLKYKTDLFECKFEELDIERKYDLIFFSESFQFVGLQEAFEQCRHYGYKYVLIADVFRKDMPEKGPIGGGHRYFAVQVAIKKFKFVELKNIDVTEYTAPSIELEADFIKNFIKPMIRVLQRMIAIKNSIYVKFLLFLNRKLLTRIKTRYLDNPERTSENFRKYKTYRFILLQV